MVRPNLSRGERTRRAILDGAYRLIIKQGFAATSMREIAVQSHVALGGIYNHFGSKEEVFQRHRGGTSSLHPDPAGSAVRGRGDS